MLVNYNKILYCTDLSENAFHAFRHAISLAIQSNSKVHVLHVVEELSADARITIQAFIMKKEDRKEALRDRATQAKAHLQKCMDDFFDNLGEEGNTARELIESIDIIEAYPAEQILKTSKKRRCDLIVMGAHEKGIKHNFLGSVAKSVLRRSSVPTLIVPLP
jgi:nucleotide-binding universal stress UspA family protein